MAYDLIRVRRVGQNFVIGVVVLSAACMLGACRDSGGGPAANLVNRTAGTGSDGSVASAGAGSNSSPSISSNSPPSISGTPPDTVKAGAGYTFAPVVTDPDNDVLSFSVTGLPHWATFDSRTGRISGTAGINDIGVYSGIRVAVSDGKSSVSLPTYGIYVVATGFGAATLSWQAPSARADGSPLFDLAGYKIYWSTDPSDFVNSVTIDNPGLQSYMIEQLTPATWYFVATAFDSTGNESDFSPPASKTII